MTVLLEDIAAELISRAGGVKRYMVAVAGPPGAGKSTLADNLASALQAKGESAEVLPMDGFHMDNAILIERGQLARKGIPETFDVRAFLDIVKAVRPGDQEVLVPVFDRSRELAIASARVVSPDHRFIIVEGNYLLSARENGPSSKACSTIRSCWPRQSRCLRSGYGLAGRATISTTRRRRPRSMKTIFRTAG
jgi:pantothenate kinase